YVSPYGFRAKSPHIVPAIASAIAAQSGRQGDIRTPMAGNPRAKWEIGALYGLAEQMNPARSGRTGKIDCSVRSDYPCPYCARAKNPRPDRPTNKSINKPKAQS